METYFSLLPIAKWIHGSWKTYGVVRHSVWILNWLSIQQLVDIEFEPTESSNIHVCFEIYFFLDTEATSVKW